ncbi:MAG TPA: 2Fe-2S iron-sulfur cluster-binding protein [Sphingobacteriaceae bacterium]|nr:2Fe-2S iron-sulfur cluster-binding protein [Sphingobacteriaceae bacterium]
MQDNLVTITVEGLDGKIEDILSPTDMNLSLMEVLKASEYDILATCGGMALCATCHVEVLNDVELTEMEDAEMDMLDTLPNAGVNSRLSCQIRINDEIDGLKIKILGSGE